MTASKIVQNLIEDDENPNDFLTRNDDVHVPTRKPTHRYLFNIGEGDYRCGIAFDIDAGSRAEAIALANQMVRKYFYDKPGRGGSYDLDPGAPTNFRVYVDDDIVITEQDIVDEYLINP